MSQTSNTPYPLVMRTRTAELLYTQKKPIDEVLSTIIAEYPQFAKRINKNKLYQLAWRMRLAWRKKGKADAAAKQVPAKTPIVRTPVAYSYSERNDNYQAHRDEIAEAAKSMRKEGLRWSVIKEEIEKSYPGCRIPGASALSRIANDLEPLHAEYIVKMQPPSGDEVLLKLSAKRFERVLKAVFDI